jgi:outer membrane protein OmpA-like peptidoglycan-associated protein
VSGRGCSYYFGNFINQRKKIAMKNTFHFTVLLVGTLSLIGCSYFDHDEELAAQKREAIDLTGQAQETNIAATPEPDVMQIISQNTDGSVEVYPLDGAGLVSQPGMTPPTTYSYGNSVNDGSIPVATVDAVPVDGNVQSVYSGDPSVQVFPLDGPIVQTATAPPPAPDQNMQLVNSATGAPATVYFERSSTSLDEADREALSNLIANNNTARGIAVEGYASTESNIADPVQRKIANLKVSMERAFNVTKELIGRGVPAELVTTVAHGENRQANTAAESRRVEVRGL